MSTVKSAVGVNALGFVTVPVHVKLEPVALQLPVGPETPALLPMTIPSASAETKQGGGANANANGFNFDPAINCLVFTQKTTAMQVGEGARLRLMRRTPMF